MSVCACVYRCVWIHVGTYVDIPVCGGQRPTSGLFLKCCPPFFETDTLWPGAHLGGSADQPVSCRDLSACLCLPGTGITSCTGSTSSFSCGFWGLHSLRSSCVYRKHCQTAPSPRSAKPSLCPCVPALWCSTHRNNSVDRFTLCRGPGWLLPDGYSEIVGKQASTQRKRKWPERLQSACFFPPRTSAFKSSAKREEQLLNCAPNISLSQTF